MKRNKAILLSAALLMAGCSSLGQSSSSYTSDKNLAYTDSYTDESYSEGMANPAVTDDLYAEAESPDLALVNAKRVYSASVSIQTLDFAKSSADLKALFNQYGGFVQSENVYSDDPYNEDGSINSRSSKTGSYLYRIPTESLNDFLDQLETIGNITDLNKSAENITQNYYDVQNMIDVLTLEQSRLNEMMEKAEDVSDMILIEEQIRSVEYELRQYQSSLSDMDLDVQYSKVWINLDEVQVYVNSSNDFFSSISQAMVNTWYYFADGIRILLVALIYLLPWVLVVCLAIWLIVYFSRRKRGKLEKKPQLPHVEDMPEDPEGAKAKEHPEDLKGPRDVKGDVPEREFEKPKDE